MSEDLSMTEEAPPRLLDFHQERIRVLHFTWIAFFMTFYVWFNLAPLSSTMRENSDWRKELKAQTRRVEGRDENLKEATRAYDRHMRKADGQRERSLRALDEALARRKQLDIYWAWVDAHANPKVMGVAEEALGGRTAEGT